MTNNLESGVKYVPYKEVLKKGRYNITTLIKRR